jgi:hypothetical protein
LDLISGGFFSHHLFAWCAQCHRTNQVHEYNHIEGDRFMPLRDHFRPPVNRQISWEEVHGMWPAVIVQHLKKQLPRGYVSAPMVHLGSQIEIDIATYERDDIASNNDLSDTDGVMGTTAMFSLESEPTLAVETELPDNDEYEVRIYNAERGRTLVAVIELVSPANKDRTEKRNAFVGKCAALLRSGVSVCIVDVVTARQANLYTELMSFIGQQDLTFTDTSPPIYAAACRWLRGDRRGKLETWSHSLKVGEPLPALPLWLTPTLNVRLDLELSYEKTCDDLSVV